MNPIRLAGRALIQAYRQIRIASLGTDPSWRSIGNGLLMQIDPADWPDQQMVLGTYEPHLRALIRLGLRENETAIDIGAHKGYFTMLIARAVGPMGMVIAADPDPRAFAALRANCERNRLHNVRSSQVAVSDTAGTCEIAINRQLGWTSRFPNGVAQPGVTSSITVPMRTLDELVGDHGRVTFIKIDAEGSEPLILRGMINTVAWHRPAIFLEINEASLATSGISAHEIPAQLSAWGYAAFAVNWTRNRFGIGKLVLTRDPFANGKPFFEALALDPSSDLMQRFSAHIR